MGASRNLLRSVFCELLLLLLLLTRHLLKPFLSHKRCDTRANSGVNSSQCRRFPLGVAVALRQR
jgi:hypothetical protein